MAIPSRQIGGSTRTALLWQISKQLEELICVRAGGCGNPTTNYNVAGCERMEYHVITYNGGDVLPEGTIVNNATPECWFIIDQTTNPADVGTITYVWPTLGECSFCIDSHTTTTTTTAEVIINVPNKFVDCTIPCGAGESCEVPFNYFDVYMTFGCDQTFPTIGCAIWLNIEGTVNFPNGSYNNSTGGCITITDGIITNII